MAHYTKAGWLPSNNELESQLDNIQVQKKELVNREDPIKYKHLMSSCALFYSDQKQITISDKK